MTSCPCCGQSFDPLRTRFVRIRQGKVTAYCSQQCIDGKVVLALPEVSPPSLPSFPEDPSTRTRSRRPWIIVLGLGIGLFVVLWLLTTP